MPYLSRQTKGFAGVSFLLVLLLIAVIGFAAYSVVTYEEPIDSGDAYKSNVSQSVQPIQDAEQLDQELAELEAIDIDAELDTSGLDEDLGSFAL